MKNILSLFIFVITILSIIGCKQDAKSSKVNNTTEISSKKTTTDKSEKSISTIGLIKNMRKVGPGALGDMISDAKTIIKHRYKKDERKSWIILDKDMWEYEFIFSGKNMTKPETLAGHWIDFNNDMTYTYGLYQEQTGSGIYTFSLDSGLLLLIDDSDKVKPQEFESKVFDRTLVMDGNHIYKDNNYNAKLKRITERPYKVN